MEGNEHIVTFPSSFSPIDLIFFVLLSGKCIPAGCLLHDRAILLSRDFPNFSPNLLGGACDLPQ